MKQGLMLCSIALGLSLAAIGPARAQDAPAAPGQTAPAKPADAKADPAKPAQQPTPATSATTDKPAAQPVTLSTEAARITAVQERHLIRLFPPRALNPDSGRTGTRDALLATNSGPRTRFAWLQDTKPQTPPAPADQAPPSRALPSPIDNPPFPMTDWTVLNTYPIGESWDVAPGWLQHELFGKKYDNTHWRLTGWLDAGGVLSTSKHNSFPYTYENIPNTIVLDQLVVELQKMPDTVQKDHIDWGFLSAHLYGWDYRYTTAKGWLANPFYSHNDKYAYDPVLQWAEVYFPKIADGALIQIGRYISPIDIEAQLSNQNYLYSHSLMFGFDPYTYTGANIQWRTSKQWSYLVGVHSGNENAFWSGVGNTNAELLVGWNSKDNRDSLWGGFDSLGDGKTRKLHDNEQIFNEVWGHKFNDRFHMQTQMYYEWQRSPVIGGTPSVGPSYPWAPTGTPVTVNGAAWANGFVNNLEYKVNKWDYWSFRTSALNDPQGWRTGVNDFYTDWTLGYSHLFNINTWIRPELRYERAWQNPSYDNGTKKDQWTLAMDLILRF